MREQINALKQLIRHPYAWPGGYPCYGVMKDGESICHVCAKEEYKQIVQATKWDLRSGWEYLGTEANWEDPELFCCHCNKRIESAYAED